MLPTLPTIVANRRTPIYRIKETTLAHNYQLLDEVERIIVICSWRADQLFADTEKRQIILDYG